MDLLAEEVKSHFKLDFIDKIIISIVFIIGAISCCFYCFASTDVTVSIIPNRWLTSVSSGDIVIINHDTRSLPYIFVTSGVSYTITNNSNSYYTVGYTSDSTDVGTVITKLASINPGNSYTYVSDETGYLVFGGSNPASVNPDVSVTADSIGFETSINILTNNVSPLAIWTIFTNTIPYIAVVILCVIGLLFIKRLINYLSKGKTRI